MGIVNSDSHFAHLGEVSGLLDTVADIRQSRGSPVFCQVCKSIIDLRPDLDIQVSEPASDLWM